MIKDDSSALIMPVFTWGEKTPTYLNINSSLYSNSPKTLYLFKIIHLAGHNHSLLQRCLFVDVSHCDMEQHISVIHKQDPSGASTLVFH